MSENDDLRKQIEALKARIDKTDEKKGLQMGEKKKVVVPLRSSKTVTTTTTVEPPAPVADPVQQYMNQQQQQPQQPQQPYMNQQGIQQVQNMGDTIDKRVAAIEVIKWLVMGRIMGFAAIFGVFLIYMFQIVELAIVGDIVFIFVIILSGYFLVRMQKQMKYLQMKYGLQPAPLIPAMGRQKQQPQQYPPQYPPQQPPPQQPPQTNPVRRDGQQW